MRFRYSLTTRATPEQAFTAFTDFGERRLDVWQKTLDPAKYEVRERGGNWAVVREGSAGVRIWVLLRYEWQPPGTIRWTLLDSDHCDAGRGEVRISPGPDGGSRVEAEIDHRRPRGFRGRAILLAQRLIGPVAFPRMWRAALDRVAAPGG
ncbi:Polyketide cyclase / dehydrase and lipid transport [Blastococcus fimeti]|nr:Polyketide cyclase / dehydrase and lipid transport [Blastococcus fimeti]